MTRRMLINAENPGEVRIAVLDGGSLAGYQIEVAEGGLQRGNIFRGVIANVQPALNAAFIDFGAEKHGFLAIQDVVPEAYYRQPSNANRARIDEVLERGKPIVVQVQKEAEGSKGAALTTNLSLAGRYLVLTPFDPVLGVSRKVEDEDVRKQLKVMVGGLKVPEGCGVIVRTNALEQTKVTLQRDLQALLRVWKRVETEARQGKGTRLLHSDQDLVLRALRDSLDQSVAEVVVDDDEAFTRCEDYMRAFMPRTKTRLVRWGERTPLFSAYEVEPQIDRIYERSVPLPGGGSIVIDRTEALTAIDVNSGRATRAASQEETALHTNLEAAREVARQLRLRDIGGLVVVDFIDMRAQKNQRKLEKELREAMKADKARFTVGKVSPNGLLEINRQRIQQALLVRTHRTCPTCGGMGRIASPEMVGLALIRRIQARAATGTLKSVRIGLHPELADALQNGRRRELADLEEEFDIKIEVVAARHLRRLEQKVEWFDREPGDERPVRPSKPARVVEPQPEPPELEAGDELEDEEESAELEAEAEGGAAGEGEEGAGNGRKRSRRRRGGRR
ncbi:MAG TPA: Rne/Rng family ribonuclease, partial [Thermoanaerobaculia bacterium]|nr:Rne/Rng family ribonuclease [Thermoanaerobaculia bacterium]